jgi:CHAD domain-containing protein
MAHDNRPAAAWALQTVRRLWADFMAREPGTLRGVDPEQLHRMRVAHRRLRTAITSFADVLPPGLNASVPELRWIGRELGGVRDLDVHLEAMTETTSRLDASPDAVEALLASVRRQRDQARKRMLDALTGPRFEALVLQIARTLREQVPTGRAGAGPAIGELAPAMLEERYRKFRKEAKHLTPRSPAADYHEARRRARRLRFATEFVEDIYGDPARDLIKAVTELQDLFGDHQDCFAAIELRRRACKSLSGRAVSLARQLDEQDLERAASLRKEGPDAVRRVRKRWKALEKAMKA